MDQLTHNLLLQAYSHYQFWKYLQLLAKSTKTADKKLLTDILNLDGLKKDNNVLKGKNNQAKTRTIRSSQATRECKSSLSHARIC